MNKCRQFLRFCLLIGLVSAVAKGQVEELPMTPEEEKRADMRLPELDRTALEPDKRLPVDVREGERNPFGLLSAPPPEEEETVQVEAETEEMKIRRILGNMRVTGRIGSPGSYQLQLGMMQLEEGDTLPRLFANQGEDLRVEKITERQIILNFVERRRLGEEALPPRSVGLGYDLSPRVRSMLPGEVFTQIISFDAKGAQSMKPLATEEIDDFIEQVGEQQLTEALTDHRRAFLGERTRRVGTEQAADEKE